jgi:cell division protein FtsZ
MAARAAVSSPLLDLSIEGARGVLFNIAGGKDLTMFEVDEAAKIISSAADTDANIIFGAVIKEGLSDQVRITVIATGFDETRSRIAQMRPSNMRPVVTGVVSEPVKSEEVISENQEMEQEDMSSNDNDDTFGEKFEIPAFLRKIH